MIGGAWPFLVRGVICLLNCVSQETNKDQFAYTCTSFVDCLLVLPANILRDVAGTLT